MEQRAAMSWARRLKRVFRIDITACERCQGSVRIITSIEDPAVIRQILAYLTQKAEEGEEGCGLTPPSRAPPGPAASQGRLFE